MLAAEPNPPAGMKSGQLDAAQQYPGRHAVWRDRVTRVVPVPLGYLTAFQNLKRRLPSRVNGAS